MARAGHGVAAADGVRTGVVIAANDGHVVVGAGEVCATPSFTPTAAEARLLDGAVTLDVSTADALASGWDRGQVTPAIPGDRRAQRRDVAGGVPTATSAGAATDDPNGLRRRPPSERSSRPDRLPQAGFVPVPEPDTGAEGPTVRPAAARPMPCTPRKDSHASR